MNKASLYTTTFDFVKTCLSIPVQTRFLGQLNKIVVSQSSKTQLHTKSENFMTPLLKFEIPKLDRDKTLSKFVSF